MRPPLRADLRHVAIAIGILAVAPLPVIGRSYYEGVLAHLVLIAVIAVALNIVFGHTDQLFLFMGGLAGLGAYGTALLSDWSGLSAWITVLVAALIAGLVGLAVSWVSAKRNFTVVLISILTLNLQLVFIETFIGARNITGGSTGMPYRDYFSITELSTAIGVPERLIIYYLALALLLVTLLSYSWLVHSRYGVAFDAIREDELAAASVGVDVVYYKTVAGFLAAFFIALAGTFMAREAGYLLPNDFGFLPIDVLVLIVLIVGGLRTTLGPVVGAAIVVAIEEFLSANAAGWRTAIFGGLLILLFLYFRRGVVVAATDHLATLRTWRGDPDRGERPAE